MSLLDQYNSLSQSLSGFTLGYYKFFDGFVLSESTTSNSWTNSTSKSLRWNGVYLLMVYLNGETIQGPHYTPLRINQQMYNDIMEIHKFIEHQKSWIQSEEAQKEFKHRRRAFREECQRRINFFVAALHKIYAGMPTGQGNRTFDPILRDIRNLAFLALKD